MTLISSKVQLFSEGHNIWRLLRKCQINWKIVSNFRCLFRMSELYTHWFKKHYYVFEHSTYHHFDEKNRPFNEIAWWQFVEIFPHQVHIFYEKATKHQLKSWFVILYLNVEFPHFLLSSFLICLICSWRFFRCSILFLICKTLFRMTELVTGHFDISYFYAIISS